MNTKFRQLSLRLMTLNVTRFTVLVSNRFRQLSLRLMTLNLKQDVCLVWN